MATATSGEYSSYTFIPMYSNKPSNAQTKKPYNYCPSQEQVTRPQWADHTSPSLHPLTGGTPISTHIPNQSPQARKPDAKLKEFIKRKPKGILIVIPIFSQCSCSYLHIHRSLKIWIGKPLRNWIWTQNGHWV
jgi:hypothetical protein